MEEDLLQILTHVFESPFFVEEKARTSRDEEEGSPLLTLNANEVYSGVSDLDLRSHSLFREDLVGALERHREIADQLLHQFYSSSVDDRIAEVVASHGGNLKNLLEDLNKFFKIYVETATDASLEKEALRLERRYFQSQGVHQQIEFIKLKRLFEKLKTFNELARENWREVYRIFDTLSLMRETAQMVRTLESDTLRNVFPLIRKLDAFLESLRVYMVANDVTHDTITNSYKINVTYQEHIRYTLKGFFGEETTEDLSETPAVSSELPSDEDEEQSSALAGSIARNIIIETRERRYNNARIYAALILGSRDWNRTVGYRMEITLKDFTISQSRLHEAFFISLDGKDPPASLTGMNARLKKGMGASQESEYVELIRHTLDEVIFQIVGEDFPSLDKPEVFLYHCGPEALFQILIHTLTDQRMGEIFLLDHSGNTVRELPLDFLRKTFVDWYNDRFHNLSGEEVDSYITYTGFVEMVKKDYRMLEEKGIQKRKIEEPESGYSGASKWLRDHKYRVFGHRKVEIFKRFLRGTVFSEEADSETLYRFLSHAGSRN